MTVARLGYEIDSSGAVVAADNLDDMAAAAKRAEAGSKGLTGGVGKAGKALGGVTFNARMLVPQLSQIGQQFTATGQLGQAVAVQAADIGLAFGVVGTVIGTVAGVALPSLIAALGSGESSADQFRDAMDELADIMDLVEQSTDVINASTDDLIQKYGMAANRVREFALAQAELAQSQAERRLRDQVGLLDTVTDRYAAVGEAVEIAGYKMENDLPIANLRSDLGVTAEQAFVLLDAFTALDTAVTFNEQQDALSGILETMKDQGVALSLLPPELQSAVSEMITLSNEADAAAAAMSRLAGAAAGVSTGVPLFMQGFSPDGLLPPTPLGKEPRRGGGGSRVDVFARDLEKLRESLRTEQEVIDEWYLEQQEILANQRAMEILGIEGHNEAKLRLEAEYQERLSGIRNGYQGSALDQTETFLGDMASALQGGNDKMIAAAQAFASVEALINAYRAYNQVIADPSLPWFAKIPAAVGVLSAGLKTVQSIKALGSSSSGAGSASSAGVTATSAAAPAPQRQDAVIQLEGALADVLAPLMDSIVRELQDQSEDGVNIVGVTAR